MRTPFGLRSPFSQGPFYQSGHIPQFTPSYLFATGEEGAWFYPSNVFTLFQDAAGTTPVTAPGQVIGRAVGAVNGIDGVQATPGFKAKYGASGGLHWLESDEADDTLPASVPDLGTDATVWYSTENGVSILVGQAVGAGLFELLRGQKTYAVGVIDRTLTDDELFDLSVFLEACRGNTAYAYWGYFASDYAEGQPA